ncbi:MAG: OmpA family protein [Magnetococcales bacterium]|nr:OmpA family protein [Magnetococcales bacterium]NGZ26870.1 OmpA family protein [Magnetococcales bacterium]
MASILTLARKRVESSDSPFWISYADMMTALVMLFMVVMSISMVAIASRPAIEKKQREAEIQEVLNKMDQHAKREGMDLEINRTSNTISFGEQARFAHDSYYLSEETKNKLRAFVPVILEAKHTVKGQRWLKRVHIEGYTDETGTYLYNVNLSLNRAQAVVCSLFSANLSADKLSELRSLLTIDGATVTGIKASREESRRVEVRLEFRQVGEDEKMISAPPMPFGNCAIQQDVDPESKKQRNKSKNPSTDGAGKKTDINQP